MRSVAHALDDLVPAAEFYGSLTGDDQASYDALEWRDERLKPAWAAIEAQRAVPVGQPAARLSFLQFMDLFTESEQLAIAGRAMTDVATKLWYDRAVGAQFIALDDPRLGDGLQVLVDDGLIDAARRTSVLDGLPPEV